MTDAFYLTSISWMITLNGRLVTVSETIQEALKSTKIVESGVKTRVWCRKMKKDSSSEMSDAGVMRKDANGWDQRLPRIRIFIV